MDEDEINENADKEIHNAIDKLIEDKYTLWEENNKLKKKIKRLEKQVQRLKGK